MSGPAQLDNKHISSSTTTSVIYRGRFAPTPSGPLHFGSLVAAVGSYLQARSQNGQWLLRLDDLDQPRNQPGASDAIIRSLEKYGFEWDEEIYSQLDHLSSYQAALEALLDAGKCYRCVCSRKTVLRDMQQLQLTVYPGTCKHLRHQDPEAAVRINVDDALIQFDDALQGNYRQQLSQQVGDFVIKRADQIFAYQLAVVVDDHKQNISEVVRGADLLDNTPRQIYLQHCLHYDTPDYVHLPIARNENGQKLSKQTGAVSIDDDDTSIMLHRALTFLGQDPAESLQFESRDVIWQWAIKNWHLTP